MQIVVIGDVELQSNLASVGRRNDRELQSTRMPFLPLQADVNVGSSMSCVRWNVDVTEFRSEGITDCIVKGLVFAEQQLDSSRWCITVDLHTKSGIHDVVSKVFVSVIDSDL